jgi:transcriptional regulator with XRE-family HTH domain
MVEKQNYFGTELRKQRKHVGYTQAKLAELAKISETYVSLLETGKKNPSDRVITKLSAALNIAENRLLITVGKVKMDLFGTLTIGRDEVPELLTNLSDKDWAELLSFLAYIQVKATILST